MDANFRLKSRDRGILNDPALAPGWAYFVDDPPYKELMKQYGDQKEVKNFISISRSFLHSFYR